MKLTRLEIELQTYGKNEGKYMGEISYENDTGRTQLVLGAEISEKLLAFIGPVIISAACSVSRQLEKDLIQSVEESKKFKSIEEVSSL